jgi:hypothetical protein
MFTIALAYAVNTILTLAGSAADHGIVLHHPRRVPRPRGSYLLLAGRRMVLLCHDCNDIADRSFSKLCKYGLVASDAVRSVLGSPRLYAFPFVIRACFVHPER